MTTATWGWATAGVLLVVLVARRVLEEWIGAAVRWLGRTVYVRLAGSRLGRRRALAHYQKALLRAYGQVPVPFQVGLDLPMDDLFVPLEVEGVGRTPILADELVDTAPRSVVLGAPGSGKSMLLRHLAHRRASLGRAAFRSGRIPILLELERLAEPDATLHELLVAQLERQDLPGAERFVAHQLARGGITLLLDGLDEVPSSERARVAGVLRDFMEAHADCRYVITCRTAVYAEELWASSPLVVRVVEFSDQQIGRFLRSWPLLDRAAVDELLLVLRRKPRIMAIARSPLLLTMVAHLYTSVYEGQPHRLPHSRAEFYRDVVDLLLSRWHGGANRYAAPKKRAVLQHLALVAQDQGGGMSDDRLGLAYKEALAAVRRVAPEIDLAPEESHDVLAEIVDRSGLLLTVDGGERYLFAHLTLQEHFAALELAGRPDELLARVIADPNRWRETIRLWCGLAPDCTAVIERLLTGQPLIALECLADAACVDDHLADEVITRMQSGLGGRSDRRHQIARAFGAVAANPHPRGARVLSWLVDVVEHGDDRIGGDAAAAGLAESCLEEAAAVLCRNRDRSAEIRRSLVEMGDVAVAPLTAPLTAADLSAIDDLVAIGTPAAACAIASGLWGSDDAVELRCAQALAHLVADPDVEAALEMPRTAGAQGTSWPMGPFRRVSRQAMPVIGRMLDVMSTAQDAPLPHAPIDPRVAAALLTLPVGHHGESVTRVSVPDDVSEALGLSPTGAERDVGDLIFRMGGFLAGVAYRTPRDWLTVWQWSLTGMPQLAARRGLLEAVPTDMRSSFAAAALDLSGKYSTIAYAALARPPDPSFRVLRSRYVLPFAGLVLALVAGFVVALTGLGPADPVGWPAWVTVAAAACVVVGLGIAAYWAREDGEMVALILAVSPILGFVVLTDAGMRPRLDVEDVTLVLASPLVPVLLIGNGALILSLDAWWASVMAALLLVGWAVWAGCAYYVGAGLQSQPKNPFRALLAAPTGGRPGVRPGRGGRR